jgi:hypothetical protein
MSIEKRTKDIYGTKDKLKKINFSGVIEILILIFIVITSVNMEYYFVPIYFTVIFILIQLKKVIDYIIKKGEKKDNKNE